MHMSMLTRWDPFSEISRLQTDVDRLFGESRRRAVAPAVDIVEDEEAIVLKAELPGFPADAVNVNVENDVLTLSGERKLEREDKNERYHRIERSYGTFSRSFMLPKTVDSEAIEANLDAGVLTLRLPKKAAAEKRRIEVSTTE